MAGPRVRSGVRVESDFVEAGVDAVYALLYLAETQSGGDAERALEEADAACRDARRRLGGLADEDAARRAPQLERLAKLIAALRRTRQPPPPEHEGHHTAGEHQ